MNGQPEIDEGLYSRQLYVMGREGMQQMAESSVLICGVGGLGVEIAKNVVLAGVRSVTLFDQKCVCVQDLSTQFFCTEDDIGKNRAKVSLPKLQELNTHVALDIYDKTELLPHSSLMHFQVVVLSDSSLDEELAIGDFCHQNSIKFIAVSTRGLFGRLFCDFGDEFVIQDSTGEEPLSVMIQNINSDTRTIKRCDLETDSKDGTEVEIEEGVVLCLEESRHGFENGTYVTFSEVRGMTELNGCEPRRIRVIGPDMFSIGDIRGYKKYEGGGICVEVKMPTKMSFKPMSEALYSADFVMSDLAKFDRPEQLHILFQALDAFVKASKGSYPRAWNKADAVVFSRCVQGVLARTGPVPMVVGDAVESGEKQNNCGVEIDENLVKAFAYTAAGNVMPIQAVIGGTAAQEVMKACSKRFNPIKQWFYFDALECLPLPLTDIDKMANDFSGTSMLSPTSKLCRYASQIDVFGLTFQKRLSSSRFFLVGCGAIGCELLKNLAVMGASCNVGDGEAGRIFVTDMDSIERSNLNRQFLFRPSDIQKMKSKTAAEAVRKMNPQIQVEAHELKVGSDDAESVYTEPFFKRIDCVINALDNVAARLFVDGQCVLYGKPLLESGTLGTKGNTQVIIPHLTESYGSSRDPPEKSIPMCTLHNFPYQVEHTIQWARDLFEGVFTQAAESAVSYLRNPSDYLKRVSSLAGNQPIDELEGLKTNIIDEVPTSFLDCVRWARLLFETKFNNVIRQLLYNFPPDHKTTAGSLFWSGAKRCPHVIEFDSSKLTHLAFIHSAANIRAHVYSMAYNNDLVAIKKMADSVNVPTFIPKSGVRIAANDSELEEMGGISDSGKISALTRDLSEAKINSNLKIRIEEFEKDDDSNFHIDFVTATSNLRAENYNIAPADRLKTKLIAGKIIPAIATTTSIIAGLVCLELYKLAQNHKNIEVYKNVFLNLALPLFVFSEPKAPQFSKYGETKFSIWDKLEFFGDCTMEMFINKFKTEHNLSITMISQGNALLYAFFLDAKKKQERLKMKISEVIELITKKRIGSHALSIILEVCAEDEDGEEVEVPTIKINIR